MSEKSKAIKRRFNFMKGRRVNWELHWQECADYVNTRKNTVTRTQFPGNKRNLQIYESTAIQSLELLASALHSMLTNPSTFWFELTSGDPELDRLENVSRWHQDTARKMHLILNNTNFQQEIYSYYMDLGCFGTAALAIEEDEKDVVCFSAKFIGNIYISENNFGLIDTIYREFKFTARQAIQEFGEENVGKSIRKAMDTNNDPETEFEFIHAIFPKMDVSGYKTFKQDWVSVYVQLKDDKIVRTDGFNEFPYAVSRWSKGTEETYGRSPAMKALPDIKMINEIMRTTIRGAQKTIDPPLMLPDDGFVLPIRTTPGGLNYYRAGSTDRIQPLVTDARVDFGFQFIAEISKRIRDAFFIDQLLLSQGPQMTATEVIQRTEEKLRVLGPILARQQKELLRPLIDRLFNIMLRKDIIKEEDIPEELDEMKIDVQYTGLIARSQKTSDAQTILRTIQDAAPFIQTDPSVMDNFDPDKALRHIASLHNMPQIIFRKESEVEEIRAGRAKAQQAQIQQEQQVAAVDSAAKLAPLAEQLPAALPEEV